MEEVSPCSPPLSSFFFKAISPYLADDQQLQWLSPAPHPSPSFWCSRVFTDSSAFFRIESPTFPLRFSFPRTKTRLSIPDELFPQRLVVPFRSVGVSCGGPTGQQSNSILGRTSSILATSVRCHEPECLRTEVNTSPSGSTVPHGVLNTTRDRHR